MRLFRTSMAATAMALVIGAAPIAHAQDADKKVAGGGITVKGWQGKADAGNKQGLTITDAKFAPEGKDIRITTGPAALYWNPAQVGKGDYTVKATFREPKQTYNHPHPFGVFIGGSGLDTDAANALYCVAYRNGNYVVRGFSNGKPWGPVRKPTPHEAVKKAESQDAEVVQEVALSVKGDKVECMINGASVWSGTKADVTGDGKVPSTDGIAGIRLSHNSDVIVSNFSVSK